MHIYIYTSIYIYAHTHPAYIYTYIYTAHQRVYKHPNVNTWACHITVAHCLGRNQKPLFLLWLIQQPLLRPGPPAERPALAHKPPKSKTKYNIRRPHLGTNACRCTHRQAYTCICIQMDAFACTCMHKHA